MALLPGYPQTNSVIQGVNGRDRTGTAVSTNIVIKVNGISVGAIKHLNVNESRQIGMIDELGTDGHIDSVPTRSTDVSGSCERVRYDAMRITEAFARGFLHAKAQRIPFDIVILDKWQGDGSNTLITTIKNVWIKEVSYNYQADNWIIVDTMNWVAEDIYSTINGQPAATGGVRGGSILQINDIEQQSDTGKRLGSLDAPNLLTDYFK